ncbi:DNA-binding transcriptional regulator, AcrR family [Amycolatopsis xylanica]|uniref:DNA-binding transcriptional regulator, AcrR family n=1 Tax=Amycolatopsis xylanica TaxID=589385 RepID=A0A1H3PB50_9PSEU|nr:TetR/AcrR family transcriptional regulator [Amycolatopsis xylanica]SDY98045.1 DNA-binding transcriptional regulator, AcrR family [Amycolatopsis xylanica]
MALNGRKAQAARNDEIIVAAAREVFIADPSAPIAAVADHAGVGISALYRRYPSKDDLLRKLCFDGLMTHIETLEAALADDGDAWTVFETFMRRVVEKDTHSITIALAGKFTPSEELYDAAARAGRLGTELMDRTRKAGAIRADFSDADLGAVFEQLAAIHIGDEERTSALRQRYLTLVLDGLRTATTPLPGTPPTLEERAQRWAVP